MNFEHIIKPFLLNKRLNNAWLITNTMQIYVRKSPRVMDFNPVNALDIANVIVTNACRGQGLFTTLLTEIEQRAPQYVDGLYFESVINARLGDFLTRRGYTERSIMSVRDFYLRFDKESK